DAYARPILLLPPAVDDGALAALETLKGSGYKLALVSNIMRTPGATLRQLLGRFRLLGYFEQTTFSDEVGIRKPAPEIFALTLRAIGGDAVGVRFEHAIRDAAVVGRAPEIAASPAEDFGAAVLTISQDEPERPEARDPVLGIVQAQLGTEARDLPLRRELGQGQLDQALHLFGKQHRCSSSDRPCRGGEQGGCHGDLNQDPRLKNRGFEPFRAMGRGRQRPDVQAANGVTVPRLRTHWPL